ncbi:hypothetical protein ACOSQ3_001756 [Xanthoceras sorbifolium]
MFKFNVDASVSSSSGRVEMGLMIRNFASQAMAAGAVCMDGFFYPLITKAAAITRGLQFALETGLSFVMLESNSLGVINAILTCSVPCSDLGLVLCDIFFALECIGCC